MSSGPDAFTEPGQFAVWLRDQLEQHGMTNHELARRSGVSPGAISRITRGLIEPHLTTAARLAAALDVPLVSIERQHPACWRVLATVRGRPWWPIVTAFSRIEAAGKARAIAPGAMEVQEVVFLHSGAKARGPHHSTHGLGAPRYAGAEPAGG